MQLKSSDKEVLATKSGFDSLKDIATKSKIDFGGELSAVKVAR